MENPTSKLEITVRALRRAWELHYTKGEIQKAYDDLAVARWHYEMSIMEKSRMDPAALAKCIPLAEDCVRFIRTGR